MNKEKIERTERKERNDREEEENARKAKVWENRLFDRDSSVEVGLVFAIS